MTVLQNDANRTTRYRGLGYRSRAGRGRLNTSGKVFVPSTTQPRELDTGQGPKSPIRGVGPNSDVTVTVPPSAVDFESQRPQEPGRADVGGSSTHAMSDRSFERLFLRELCRGGHRSAGRCCRARQPRREWRLAAPTGVPRASGASSSSSSTKSASIASARARSRRVTSTNSHASCDQSRAPCCPCVGHRL